MRGTVGIYAGEIADGRYISFSGGFSVASELAGLAGVTAIAFDEMSLGVFGCDAASGTASIRDVAGVWHDGFFAETEDPAGIDVCNACGDMLVHGETVGDFCSDAEALATFVAWETALW